MQLAGATLAALVARACCSTRASPSTTARRSIAKSFFQSDWSGFWAEGLGTFLLMATIIGTAVIAKNKSDLTAVAHRRRARHRRSCASAR